MIGIDVAACPEPDGMKKFSTVWNSSIAMPDSHSGRFASGAARPFTTVSMMLPFCSTIRIPREIPTSSAGIAASAKPFANVSPTSLMFMAAII